MGAEIEGFEGLDEGPAVKRVSYDLPADLVDWIENEHLRRRAGRVPRSQKAQIVADALEAGLSKVAPDTREGAFPGDA